MSGAVMKATRRAIRRAFGEEAVGTLGDHDLALRHHTAVLTQHAQDLARLDAAVTKLDESLSLHLKLSNDELGQMRRVVARVRWLLTGA